MFPPHFSIANLSTDTIKPTHDLSQFDCSQNDVSGVNDFLQLEALKYHDENMGVIHLFFYEDELVGFVTISMTYVARAFDMLHRYSDVSLFRGELVRVPQQIDHKLAKSNLIKICY